MKANKIVVAGLSLALSLSMVACNKKENTPANGDKTTIEQNTADTTNNANNDYVEKYSRFYGDTLGKLSKFFNLASIFDIVFSPSAINF